MINTNENNPKGNLKDLYEAERLREISMANKGYEKYLKDQKFKETREGGDRTDSASKIIQGVLPLVSQEVTNWVASSSNQGKGSTSKALAPLKLLDPDLVALVGLQATFRSIVKGGTEANLQVSIGHLIEVELEAEMLAQKCPKAYKAFQKLAAKETSTSRNLKRHESLAERNEVRLNWGTLMRHKVGGAVLNCILLGASDIFERRANAGPDNRQNIITFTPEAEEFIIETNEATAWLRPRLEPMVVPPRSWTHYDSGAYLDPRLAKTVPLVRTYSGKHRRLIQEAIAKGEMDEVLRAVNLIQSTPYKIDTRVLAVIKEIKELGLRPSDSFPLSDVPALPAKLPEEEWLEASPEKRSALSRDRKKKRDIRMAAAANTGVFASDIAQAEELAEFPAFYLPHSLDFRGRIYAVPHFNFQRSDHVKALFLFAEGKPLGQDGIRWLKIHLANCGDFNKISKETFDDRVKWVDDNEALILAIAKDPVGMITEWANPEDKTKRADNPFCFLQACFEYREFVLSAYDPNFVSHISIALDGSCSGLQHFAAMTRSEEEGRYVNLVPSEKPQDVYKVVAAAAQLTLEAEAQKGCLFASTILEQGYGRGWAKRNTMTYFYGSNASGMTDQQMEDLMRPIADKVALGDPEYPTHPFSFKIRREVYEGTGKDKKVVEVREEEDQGYTCAHMIAKHNFNAIVSVAPKAAEAAKYFQDVAGVLAHESLPMIWKTPCGLPVLHQYNEWESKRVSSWIYDRKIVVGEYQGGKVEIDEQGRVFKRVSALLRVKVTQRIDKRKARSAVSPNMVHSMDAAHLMRVVLESADWDIRNFMLIHDSFATHAGNTEWFFGIIRQAFAGTYRDYCPFQVVDAYARSVLSETGIKKLPKIPAKGTLDLEQITESLFAFA